MTSCNAPYTPTSVIFPQLVDHVWQRYPNMRVAFKNMLVKSRKDVQAASQEDSKVSLFAFAKALKDWHIDASPAEVKCTTQEALDPDPSTLHLVV